VSRKIKEFSSLTGCQDAKVRASERKWLKVYEDTNLRLEEALDSALKKPFPVCRVFITFEYECDQRRCLKEMEVPDFDAMFDRKHNIQKEYLFKSTKNKSAPANVLNVREAAEPDNIKWENIEVSNMTKHQMNAFGFAVIVSLLFGTYFVLIYVSNLLQSIVIAIIDFLLVEISSFLTDLSTPESEDKKQSSLQLKLFLARLLISTLFPYMQSNWSDFLSESFIQGTILTQLITCFVTPMIYLADLSGIINRNLVAPINSQTQAELNSFWSGTPWSLAERYTVVSKVLFISLFYALLTPSSLFIGMFALILLFFVDQFLLLRRWKPVGSLDSSGLLYSS
jgi:hypothetical protein